MSNNNRLATVEEKEEAIAKLKAGTMIGHEVGGTRKVIDVVKLKTISKG